MTLDGDITVLFISAIIRQLVAEQIEARENERYARETTQMILAILFQCDAYITNIYYCQTK